MLPRTRGRRGHIEPLPSGNFRAVVFTGIDPLTRRRRIWRCVSAGHRGVGWLTKSSASAPSGGLTALSRMKLAVELGELSRTLQLS